MTLEEGGRGPWARSGRGTRGLRGDIQHSSFGIYHFKTLCMWGTPQKTPTVVSGFSKFQSHRHPDQHHCHRVTCHEQSQTSKVKARFHSGAVCSPPWCALQHDVSYTQSQRGLFQADSLSHTDVRQSSLRLDSLQTVSESIEKSLGVTARDALHPS